MARTRIVFAITTVLAVFLTEYGLFNFHIQKGVGFVAIGSLFVMVATWNFARETETEPSGENEACHKCFTAAAFIVAFGLTFYGLSTMLASFNKKATLCLGCFAIMDSTFGLTKSMCRNERIDKCIEEFRENGTM